MEFGAVFEMIFALLTLVGIGCLGGYIREVLFLPAELLMAIRIFDDVARENADILLSEANRMIWRGAGRETVVLLSSRYKDDGELISLIEDSGMMYYLIDK